jgi:hypothetical protein
MMSGYLPDWFPGITWGDGFILSLRRVTEGNGSGRKAPAVQFTYFTQPHPWNRFPN